MKIAARWREILVQRKVERDRRYRGSGRAGRARCTPVIPWLFIQRQPSRACLVSSFNRPWPQSHRGQSRYHALDLKTSRNVARVRTGRHESAVLASPGRFSPEAEAKFYKEKRMVAIRSIPNGGWRIPSRQPSNGARAFSFAADPFYFNRRDRIAALAAQYKIPALYPGGNMLWPRSLSNGQASRMHIDRSAFMLAASPWGAAAGPPGCIGRRMELVINRKTANALHLRSPLLIARADELSIDA